MPEKTATAKPAPAPASRDGAPVSVAPPCIMVICGATGDLARRKLFPSLYNLAQAHHLSSNFAIVGFAFDKFSPDEYRDQLTKDMHTFAGEEIDKDVWNWFLKRIYYINGDFRDPAVYQQLKD